ncbi:MAG: M10 family metallopeptidase C-terminal domain-containing protein [Hyphomonadaceae bacterium]|nr:M10 family metallopeptidase C-terminal domain-containing protein [Hyphomonadaceae bacterium]
MTAGLRGRDSGGWGYGVDSARFAIDAYGQGDAARTWGADRFGAGDDGAILRCTCPACTGALNTIREQTVLPSDGTAANGKPVFSWDQAAVQLTRGGYTWSAVQGAGVTITYAFRSTEPTTMPEGTGGFVRFNAAQIAAAEAALALWADVANITFVRVGSGSGGEGAYSDSATILFANYTTETGSAAGFAYLPSPGQTGSASLAGDIWIDVSETYNTAPVFGEYGAQVLAHEIGHAIGLRHPSDYDGGTPTYEANATWWQDSRMFTIMSYFGSGNVGGSLPAFSAGPQMFDIAAAQRLYGANTNTRTGDTVYGFNSNTGLQHFTLTGAASNAVFSIWDGGGNDTLDLSGYAQNADIDLRAESFTSAGPGNSGAAGLYNISIARGVVIENGVGGSGNDTLTGNGAANRLTGNAGNDVLEGAAGADTLVGGLGSDSYGVDSLADVVTELASEGFDAVYTSIDYTLGANLEQLNLTGAAVNGFGNSLANAMFGNELDNLLSGGAGDDVLTGNGGNDILQGAAGNDIMFGGLGSDSYGADSSGDAIGENAGEGFDAVYSTSDYTLGANLEQLNLIGTGVNGFGNALANAIFGNELANYLGGGAGDDVLHGNGGNDILEGSTGNDIMFGGLGSDSYGADSSGDAIGENVGEGFDAVYSTASYTLGANLEQLNLIGTATEGYGNGLANAIFGNALDNILNGGTGDDVLNGGAGNDTFLFLPGTGHDVVTDFVAGGVDDRVDLSAYAGTGITYVLIQTGADAVFNFSNGDQIVLVGVNSASLVQSGDFWL